MKDKIIERVNQLKAELGAGENLIQELDVKKTETIRTTLRISGAIQVLEELLENESANIQEIPSSEEKIA